MAIKYKNIVGAAFLPYVKDQFSQRKSIAKTLPRSNKEISYLTNRNAWFRLSSSANTTSLTREDINLKNIVNNSSGTFASDFTPKLAKNNVLQGGILSIGGEENDKTILRKGFKQTYKKGPTDDLGFKPMPGITGITVGTGGKWQTLMQADIEFICYDLDQLNEMSKLYMSLGVTCFLEWGHIPYINNAGKLETKNLPLNFFNYKDKLKLIKNTAKRRKDTDGNYDGFLGTVYNFSYQGDKDGGYLCKTSLMGAGGMVESLKINTAFNVDFTNAKDNNLASSYYCTIDNALDAMHELLLYSAGAKTSVVSQFTSTIASTIAGGVTAGVSSLVGKSISKQYKERTFGKITKDTFFKDFVTKDNSSNNPNYNKSWGELLNNIYGTSTYTPFTFSPLGEGGTIKYFNSEAEFGNAHQLLNGTISEKEGTDGLSPIPADFYLGYIGQWDGSFWPWKDSDDYQSYITLGHLLALINSLSIFVEGKTDPCSTEKNISPILYIDYHPDNTIIDLAPITATINPYKCIVPFIANKPYLGYFSPLDTTGTGYEWLNQGTQALSEHNLADPSVLNRINSTYPPSQFLSEKSPKGGKLMNVLINTSFARECLRTTKDSNNDVNLIEYISKILNGVNESLGGVNNLRPFVDECGTILRIIDEKAIDPKLIKDELVEIPTFGLSSIAYESSYNSSITPKLASQIVIATQAVGSGGIKEFSEDVLSYQSLNGFDVVDRFSTNKFPAIGKTICNPPVPTVQTGVVDLSTFDLGTPKLTPEEQQHHKHLKALKKLYDHLWTVYTPEPENVESKDCLNMLSQYIDLSNKEAKNQDKNDPDQNKNKSSILIPLEYTVKIDGIGGILPYNAFTIPNNRLPERYRNKVAFAVFSINHSFEDNNWFTTLRGQTIMLNTFKPTCAPTTSKATSLLTPTQNNRNTSDYPPVKLTGSEVDIPDLKDSPSGGTVTNTTKTSNETETFVNFTTGPDGLQSATFDTVPITSNADIEAAFIFIANNETNGTPELKAYKDTDYTVSTGFTYRIGYGSDTVTDANGRVTKVTSSSRTTSEDAKFDLTRRITNDFKPKVVSRLNSRGVNYNDLPLKVQVVFLDLAYNYGTLWFDFIEAYKSDGKAGIIAELNRRIARGESQVPSRRRKEIAYLNG